MLRFFRHIRQRLLTDNPPDQTSRAGKFSKYLLYAVGEILLVVIGILIALQVDNWNEERQLDEAIDKSLIKLRGDLLYDLAQFDHLDSIHSSWKEQNVNITDKLISGEMKKVDSREEFVPGRGTFLFLTIKTSSQQEMINTGLMYKLESVLQQEIDDYYELARFEMVKLNADLQDYANHFLSIEKRRYLNAAQRLGYDRNIEYIDWSWLNDPYSDQYIDFENMLGWHYGLIRDYELVLDKLRNQAQKTIASINNELDR